VTLLLDSLLLPFPVSVDEELRQVTLRIMLSMSGRFLPPQAEDEDEEAAETEQDADDDAVCCSIRPTMTGRAHRRPRRSPNPQAAAGGRKDRGESAREDEAARHSC